MQITQSGLLNFIEVLQSQSLEANLETFRLVSEDKDSEKLVILAAKKKEEVSSFKQSVYALKCTIEDLKGNISDELYDICPLLANEKYKHMKSLIEAQLIGGTTQTANAIYKKRIASLKHLEKTDFIPMLSDFAYYVEELEQAKADLVKIKNKKETLYREIDNIEQQIDAKAAAIYSNQYKKFANHKDLELNWNPLALSYNRIEHKVENQGAFRFKANELAEALTRVKEVILRKSSDEYSYDGNGNKIRSSNSMNSVQNAMAMFFPTILADEKNRNSMVTVINNPRPLVMDRDCRRFIRASSRFHSKFDSNELLEETKNLIVNFLFDLVLAKEFNTGDADFDRQCMQVDKSRVLEIIERITFDLKGYIQNYYKPQKTLNCKGQPLEVKAVVLQLKEIFDLDDADYLDQYSLEPTVKLDRRAKKEQKKLEEEQAKTAA